MPELPEVETIVRTLRPHLIGKKIRSLKVITPKILRGPWPSSGRKIKQATIINIKRKGKMILILLNTGASLAIHLKMTGQLLLQPSRTPLDKHTHFILDFAFFGNQLRYRDVRKFGFLAFSSRTAPTEIPWLKDLGPDPFEITAAQFAGILRQKKRALKPLLLDQTVISGLGNIYVDESLHLAGIHPLTKASTLSPKKAKELHRTIRQVLRQAIRSKGSTLRDFRKPDGKAGSYQLLHRVYGREEKPCLQCGSAIKKIRVGSRGTHFCPSCQRKPEEHPFWTTSKSVSP
jgi:formamidopyrimidine-DNA glycosylase